VLQLLLVVLVAQVIYLQVVLVLLELEPLLVVEAVAQVIALQVPMPLATQAETVEMVAVAEGPLST
jgi:hypothetical protein